MEVWGVAEEEEYICGGLTYTVLIRVSISITLRCPIFLCSASMPTVWLFFFFFKQSRTPYLHCAGFSSGSPWDSYVGCAV
jgi:hypothetical protein